MVNQFTPNGGNPIQMLMQLMSSGSDPRQLLINFLSSQQNLNPMGQMLLQMAQNDDLQGATNFTKNVAKEQNIDYDQIANNVEKQISSSNRR